MTVTFHARLATLVALSALLPTPVRQASPPPQGAVVRFAVIGDSGDGDPEQAEIAVQMLKARASFPFDRVIMVGDNIYGGQSAADLERKFAIPYQGLLSAGVKFYAALGNHDATDNDKYPLFNMNGERYYTYADQNVRFLVLDSNKMDKKQLSWIDDQLKSAHEDWKICYFHHPLYSDGKTHGSEVELRVILEPLFVKYGVNVVFAGHDHFYERITPQKGIYYFVSGAAGELRKGDIRRSAMTAFGFDTDRSFMLVQVVKDDMMFKAVSRTGVTVDSGVIHRQAAPVSIGRGGF